MPTPDRSYYEAADAVLDALGFVRSPTSVNLLVAWEVEEWGWSGIQGNNPMATTLPVPGSHPLPGNPAGVQVYPSLEVGAQANAATLRNGLYPTLLAALQAGDASLFFSDAGLRELATWDGGHLSYGEAIRAIYAGLPPPPGWAVAPPAGGGGAVPPVYVPPAFTAGGVLVAALLALAGAGAVVYAASRR